MKIALIGLMILSLKLSAAVHISQNGKAEAMIIPYYTVANNLVTLLTIDNTTEDFKAIKIHLREAKNGDAIYTFNLYLQPKDMWAAGLINNNGFVNFLAPDESCTLNLDNLTGPPPEIPGGGWEWQTGILEIIEMGVVDTTQLPDMNNENRCQILNDAWEAQGPNSLWRADGTNAMLPISGGLQAHTRVMDVSNGFSFEVPVIHLDHFYPESSIDNQPPESETPNLDSGDHTSLLIHNGQAITTEWPTGYEAVSALLMKTTLENEFETNPDFGAQTEWIISFPTAGYHLANTESTVPFIKDNNGFNFPMDYGFNWRAYDREGLYYFFECFILCPPIPFGTVNHNVNTYLINPPEYQLPISILSGEQRDNVLPFSIMNYNFRSEEDNGKIVLSISDYGYYDFNNRGVELNSQNPHTYHGLPVVGFAFQVYKNANAQPGLLATYATTKVHTGDVLIETESPDSK